MFWLTAFCLLGSNVASIIFLGKFEIWTAQAIWIQAFIALMFSYSFFVKGRAVENKWLGLLFLWVTLNTITFIGLTLLKMGENHEVVFSAFNVLSSKIKDDMTFKISKDMGLVIGQMIRFSRHFITYFNILAIVIFYRTITGYLNKEDVVRLIEWLRWGLIVTLIICVLQYFNLDQFFFNKYTGKHQEADWLNNPVIGFIGNGTHLSGYLAMMAPVLFIKKDWFLWVPLLILVLCFSGTTAGDPALVGFVVLAVVSLFYVINKKPALGFTMLGVGLILSTLYIVVVKDFRFFSDNGRFQLWQIYWENLHKAPITGVGLGMVKDQAVFAPTEALKTAKHLHLEYFQIWYEIGLVGLILTMKVIYDFFRKNHCDIGLICKCVVLGFLVSGLFNYPFHLWHVSTTAVFFYGAVEVLNV